MSFLKVCQLKVSVGDKEVLQGVDLSVPFGEFHVLMGPNGSGKSTLARVLMGDPKYPLNSGQIFLADADITSLSPEERSKLGLFMTFQAPMQIPGLKIFDFLKFLYEKTHPQHPYSLGQLRQKFKEYAQLVHLDPTLLKRYFNVGFSGGEAKKFELLQVLVASPRFLILDEVDSGLDVDSQKQLAHLIQDHFRPLNMSILMITHSQYMVELLSPNAIHILKNGKIVETGSNNLLKNIGDGFQSLEGGLEL